MTNYQQNLGFQAIMFSEPQKICQMYFQTQNQILVPALSQMSSFLYFFSQGNPVMLIQIQNVDNLFSSVNIFPRVLFSFSIVYQYFTIPVSIKVNVINVSINTNMLISLLI